MKILVLQLARFGDIFQTWPTLQALQRLHPNAQIDLMVRERFKEAASPLEAMGFAVVTFRSGHYLEPAYFGEGDPETLKERIEADLSAWNQENYDLIINLSFSPLASFLVDAIRGEQTEIRGYTRHRDGFLNIVDDASAYFYAQVGIGKSNRYHLTDIFAAVAGVDLCDGDFSHPASREARSKQIVVHMGASQAQKTYPPEMWVKVLKNLVESDVESIALVGSTSERNVADEVARQVNSSKVENRVGQSTLKELSQWIAEAHLMMGADSGPMQIASLTGTQVLNLSCAQVNFWETGPVTPGSVVLYGKTMADISPSRVAEAARKMYSGQSWTECEDKEFFAVRGSREEGYVTFGESSDFGWKLVQALYTPVDFPPLADGDAAVDFQRVYETAEMGLSLYKKWQQEGPSAQTVELVQMVDSILETLSREAPRVAPVLAWFQTERLRIGPEASDKILDRTLALFEQLATIAKVYVTKDLEKGLQSLETSIQVCGPALREFKFASIEVEFQKLLSVIQGLSVGSTKVGWSSVLGRISAGLERRDYIEIADILEFELVGELQRLLSPDETKAQDVII